MEQDDPGVPPEPMSSPTDISESHCHGDNDDEDDDNDDNESLPELECAVCFSQFNNVFNTPKVLGCGHTFCLECLARMNVKSTQPESLQCPLCRAYTPLPTLGLPKLATDTEVLSHLPDTMQHIYSIRFNRSKGKLQVKRVPSSVPASPAMQHRSLDVGMPVSSSVALDSPRGVRQAFSHLLRNPTCRAFFMISVVLIMVTLTVTIGLLLSRR